MQKKYDINKIHRLLLWKKNKYFVKSLFVKTKALFVDFIPLNEITEEYCTEKIFLNPERKIQTYLPFGIGEQQKFIDNTSPAITAFLLKKVMVIGNSSFFLTIKKNKIFYEKLHTDSRSIYLYNDRNLGFHSDTLAKIINLPIKEHLYDAIYFGGIFTFNYYHFLVEILAKTEYLKEIPNYKTLKVVLDISIQENENLKNLVDFFLKDFQVEYLENDHYHSFNNLWFINTPNPTIPNIVEGAKYEAAFTKLSPESIDYIRNICLINFDINQVKAKSISRVFIARKSQFRKYNESELLFIAQKHGFTPVYFEDLNLHEQIFIMQNAEYIIGSSGAAWTNLLFARPQSKGLIWLGSVWGDFSVFSTLAKLAHFDLYHLRFKNSSSDFHENYTLNPQIFEEQIIQLLKL